MAEIFESKDFTLGLSVTLTLQQVTSCSCISDLEWRKSVEKQWKYLDFRKLIFWPWPSYSCEPEPHCHRYIKSICDQKYVTQVSWKSVDKCLRYLSKNTWPWVSLWPWPCNKWRHAHAVPIQLHWQLILIKNEKNRLKNNGDIHILKCWPFDLDLHEAVTLNQKCYK